MGRPLIYSKGQENRNQQYFLSGFFAFLFVVFLGFGLFIGLNKGEWWPMYFLVPIALIIGVLAFSFFPRQQKAFYKMAVYDDHLVQQWKNEQSPEVFERTIHFSDVSECVIGIVSRNIAGPKEKDAYRYHGLILLNYKDGQFKQEILSQNELYEWRRRLFNKVQLIKYATEDLTKYIDKPVKIEEIETSEENVIGPLVGTEHSQPFEKINKK